MLKLVFKISIEIYQAYIMPSHKRITKPIMIVVSDIKTPERQVSSTIQTVSASKGQPRVHGRCEMDSHADTTVAGRNCAILKYTDSTVLDKVHSHEGRADSLDRHRVHIREQTELHPRLS